MLSTLIQAYCWIALFTAVSIWAGWTFTGSKENYRYLNDRLVLVSEGKTSLYVTGFLMVWVLGSLLWPITYYCRVSDVLREGRSKQ